VARHYGAVTDVNFAAESPFTFAVTASTRVMVYDPRTRELKRQFTRFQDKAYGGALRSDGRLLCAGGEQALVQVFDCASRSLLRQFKGHTKAVHGTCFAKDRTHLVSASDDVTVRYWDITEGRQVHRFDGHADYVRSVAASPAFEEVCATGGYDHAVKLWDARSGKCEATLDLGHPVEALCFLPGGTALAACGGTRVAVFDLLRQGAPLFSAENHQKTVTSLCATAFVGRDESPGSRLVAGSLDGYVKAYELDSFQVTYAGKYAAPVTAVGVSPDGSTLAVGMADGVLSLKKHTKLDPTDPDAAPAEDQRPKRQWLTQHNYKYFVRGQGERAGEDAHVVHKERRAKLQQYDRLLRKFRHREALDAALETGNPVTVDAVLTAVSQRGALDAAVGGRSLGGLQPLLRHLCKYVPDSRFTAPLLEVASRVVDFYAGEMGKSPEVDQLFLQLRDAVAQEVRLQRTLMEVQGTLEPILARSYAASGSGR